MGQQSRYIAIFPEVPSQIHELRSACDPLAETVRPHLTLVFPFVSEVSDACLLDHLADCLPKEPSHPSIRLREITAHGEYLFLNVKSGNDVLIALHDRLYSGPLAAQHSPLFTFIPHMTVGRRPSDEKAALALLTAQNQRKIDVLFSEAPLCLVQANGNRPDTIIGMRGCRF